MAEEIVKHLKNDISETGKIESYVNEFIEANGLEGAPLFKIVLALDEVITNVIEYGFADEGEHVFILRMTLEDCRMRFIVEDDAPPFNPLQEAAPNLGMPLEKREIGGLGIHIVRQVMDELSYERKEDRNVLTMFKNLQKAQQG